MQVGVAALRAVAAHVVRPDRAAVAVTVAGARGIALRAAVVAAHGAVAGGRGVGVEERREGVPRARPLRRSGGAVGRGRGGARALGAVGGHHRIEGEEPR